MARLLGMCVLAMVVNAAQPSTPSSMQELTFLTRDDCVNTPDLVFNLDDALKALGWPADYQYINIGTLPKTDVRTAYPTPTLYRGKDLFGMPRPKPPYDTPS